MSVGGGEPDEDFLKTANEVAKEVFGKGFSVVRFRSGDGIDCVGVRVSLPDNKTYLPWKHGKGSVHRDKGPGDL